MFADLSEEQLTPPILVIGDAVDLFLTVKAAERYLEPADISMLQVLDSTGLVLKPVVERRFLAKIVRLEDSSDESRDVAALRIGLIRLIQANASAPRDELERLSIDRLLDQSISYATK